MTEIVKHQSGGGALAYMDNEQVLQMAQIVQKVAPWANGMGAQEIGLAVRRAMSMGVDPLNPHEIQIWKDWNGTINVQLAYALMVEWVRKFKGQHTEPRYYRLTQEQLEEEGFNTDDIAYRVEFVMLENLPKMVEYSETLGDEARAMFTVTGMGAASREDWDRKSKKGNDIFAPNGRSKAWKVKKRALVDAYRSHFGTPTKAEIEELRRGLGYAEISQGDWEYAASAAPEADEEGLLELARHHAKSQTLTTTDQAAARDALFGAPEIVVETPTPPQTEEQLTEWMEEQAEVPAETSVTTTTDEVPADLPQKWPAFCMVAKSELGYDSIPHVLGTLQKERGNDDYQPFVTGGKEVGNVINPAEDWAILVKHQAAK